MCSRGEKPKERRTKCWSIKQKTSLSVARKDTERKKIKSNVPVVLKKMIIMMIILDTDITSRHVIEQPLAAGLPASQVENI